MKHILAADSIELSFGPRRILSGASLHSETGRITGVLGRNGTGKSCLFRTIAGVMKAGNSYVAIDGKPAGTISGLPAITMLPQFHFIPPSLSLKQVFRDFGLSFDPFAAVFPRFASCYTSRLRTLSKGSRRLVEAYCIIRSEAQFSLLDEPFSNIDPLDVAQVKALLAEAKQHKGLIVSDHMHADVREVADELYVLHEQTLYIAKTPADLERYQYLRSR